MPKIFRGKSARRKRGKFLWDKGGMVNLLINERRKVPVIKQLFYQPVRQNLFMYYGLFKMK